MRCRPRSDIIVAVGGLEPPTSPSASFTSLSAGCALHTELHGIPYILQASPKPSELFCPEWGIPFSPALPSLFRFVCCLLATIQPTSHVPPSLGLTLLPICPVCCDSIATVIPSRGSYRFGNYLAPPVVLTDWLPSLSTPSACRSISMPFRFHHPASPVLQYVSLLTGIARCTSLGVCGRWRTRTACSS